MEDKTTPVPVDKNNCSNHKKDIAGTSDMKVLAEMIGDLHYEVLSDFLHCLAYKISVDGAKDYSNKKKQLGIELMAAGSSLKGAANNVTQAWQISKLFMDNQNKK